MSRCRNGHDSTTDDYCEVCGVPMGDTGGGDAAAASAPTVAPPAVAGCGSCGQPMLDGARFCERCGWDAEAASLSTDPLAAAPALSQQRSPGPRQPSAASAGWHLVAGADRDYFDTVTAMGGEDTPGLTFPAYWPERRFPVVGERVLIGRHSRSRGTEPDIDLGGQFADPGVSHLHAMLARQPDGTWTIVDLGSSNGTYLNDSREPIEPHVPAPVADGDRIHVGAWTTLTLAVTS